jgi:ABC-type Fe3+/spermidine/putrescine transport system ATPase subunit
LINCDRGQILLYGADMTGVPPNMRDVNMVFQGYALFPHMTVPGNVVFGLRRQGVLYGETSRRDRGSPSIRALPGQRSSHEHAR